MKKNRVTIAMAFASMFALGKANQAVHVVDDAKVVKEAPTQRKKKRNDEQPVLNPQFPEIPDLKMIANPSPIFFPKWSVKCKNRMRNVRACRS